MKRLLALFLCALTLLACTLPAQAASYVYVRHCDAYWAEPYYHKNSACSFGSNLTYCDGVELKKCSVATAEKNYCRPCPVCAYRFKPMFTGTFPKWSYSYPPYYAGVYMGDSGTYVLLMTNPTAAKAADWKKRLGCDFWVIEAKYSEKQLKNLNDFVVKNLFGKYGINSVGYGGLDNRVGIGTTDNSTANMKKIYAVLKAKGYPLDAVWIYKSEPGSADF